MQVPERTRWLFWDVDPSAIDVARDRRYVLGRVLERGRMEDVRWVFSVYGASGLREFFVAGGHPELSAPTWSLWQAFFKGSEAAWQEKATAKSNSGPWFD